MENVEPTIALVICTRNRGKRLNSFFDSLNKLQCNQPWELVIVNNGSTDETSERLTEFASNFSGRMVIENEPQPGLGRARNRGWRATTAKVIAFTDDDCYPAPDFLNLVLSVFEDASVGFSGGRILLHDITDAPVTIYEHPTVQIYRPGDFIVTGVIQGASMAFRRAALVDINGFDDHLGAGTPFAFEDVDAEQRALAAGWTGKYDPQSVVYHHHGRKPGPEIEKLTRSYDIGRGGYYMKCMLFMPQRWICLRHWLRCIKRQPFQQTRREVASAVRFFFYQFGHKLNVSY